MAQHDYVIANGTGAAVRSDLNNALAAIVTQNSGATAPATTYAYQWWADTTTGLLKIRNGANNAWITLRELDGTLTIEDGTASSPGLAFADDLNTGIYSPSADQLGITTGGTVRLTTTTTGITSALPVDVPLGTASAPTVTFTGDLNTGIYSPGADQVAISTNGTGRLFVDASGNVGVNTSNPASFGRFASLATTSSAIYATADSGYALFDGATNSSEARINIAAGTAAVGVHIWGYNSSRTGYTPLNYAGSYHVFKTDTSERMRLTATGLGIGTTSPSQALHVVGNSLIPLGNSYFTHTTNFGVGTPDSSGLQLFAQGEIRFGDRSSGSFVEKGRFDNSGRFLVGTSTARSYFSGGDVPGLQLEGTGTEGRELSVTASNSGVSGAVVLLGKQRSGTIGGNTVVQNNDQVGLISYQGSDGTKMLECVRIEAQVDGTPGVNDMPGRLVFSVTSDGSASPTERLRISNNGSIYQNFSIRRDTGNNFSQFAAGLQALPVMEFFASNGTYEATVLQSICERAASSSYAFFEGYSGAGAADREFRLRGDGNAYADGTWNGGGADYAECFEWSDSNPDTEDRRGISVVLDGDKIREAQAGEDPIGVISGNPSVVGDAAWNKWSGKYLRDEFGTYIQEDYEVEDEDGNTVIQQRRKLNPAYNPNAEYIPREQRPEWDCVGLMGKLRIRKGQVIGSRWIKMRDISDSVEEWLVR